MSSILKKSSTIIIFAYAPVGFGHLRVSDALYHGLSKDITPLLLGSQDKSISGIYRFVSIHPLTRGIMEWSQKGIGEDIFAFFYSRYLRSHVNILYHQLTTILEQRINIPDTILIVATHFGLAHQLSVLKEKLEKESRIKLILILQITDDSPQKLWYIPGADIIFCPSHKTSQKLTQYAKKMHLPLANIVVNPYPVSPLLVNHLSPVDFMNRREQVDPDRNTLIHLMIPFSGAAVGTSFYSDLILSIGYLSSRFKFHIVAKSAPYTQNFFRKVLSWQNIDLHVSLSDREVVNLYEKIYQKEIISLEITKPSEQAFKSLIYPKRRGGSLLLFSDPVGRQEFDNLDFLNRHGLIPSKQDQIFLFKKADEDGVLNQNYEIYQRISNWRGILLPKNPQKAANFINWCLKTKIFLNMMDKKEDSSTDEISPNGVEYFWKKVEKFIETIKN